MKYTKKQLGFILYNNRSVEGVVSNFFDKSIDPVKLLDIEKKFDWCKSAFEHIENMVEVDLRLLNSDANDELVKPDQLANLSELIKSNSGRFSDSERSFLTNRHITDDIISKYNILGLSQFTDYEQLRIIGATCHPILKSFLQDGIEEGGIVFPLFKNDVLINCAIRRISDVGKLKYTLAVPDLPVWNIDNIEVGEKIWICEGLFDMMSINNLGLKALSPSSAIWSGLQLYQLLEKKPRFINIFCDNDRVGLKNGAVLKKFFNLVGIESKTVRSKHCKDAAEHFFENNYTLDDIEEVRITTNMIEQKQDNSFDFLKYLQKRKF